MESKNYDELVKKIDELGDQIESASMSYWGGLLSRMIKCCRDRVFVNEKGLRAFIDNALNDKPIKKPKSKSNFKNKRTRGSNGEYR